jgi:hypothetical protein
MICIDKPHTIRPSNSGLSFRPILPVLYDVHIFHNRPMVIDKLLANPKDIEVQYRR